MSIIIPDYAPIRRAENIHAYLKKMCSQITAGYEECNDADHLRIDPALRLAIGKDHDNGAGHSMLCQMKNRIKEDKTSCHRFKANQARLKMGVIAYNLLHMIRVFYLHNEEIRRSTEWLIRRLIKVGTKIAYHDRRWHVHITSVFPLPIIIVLCWVMVNRIVLFRDKFWFDIGVCKLVCSKGVLGGFRLMILSGN